MHGAPGLSTVYVDAAGGGVLVAGDEMGAGAPAGDLGWLLGELAELAVRGGPALAPRCAALGRALHRGYGPGVDPVELDRSAVLRVFGHVHDFAAYVGWHPHLADQLDLVADLVDGHPDGAALTLSGWSGPPPRTPAPRSAD